MEHVVDKTEQGDSETGLWSEFSRARDGHVRNQLIRFYLPQVQRIAASLYAQRIGQVGEFADYLQYGRVGLLEAIDRFDPDKAVNFMSFAQHRIRGSILNGIEHASELAAQQAQRRRAKRERIKALREGTVDQKSDGTFDGMVDLAIGLALGYILEDSGLARDLREDRMADPYQNVEVRRMGERLTLILQALPDRERMIVQAHYLDQRDFIEIAAEMGLTKGRISQLHSRALRLMREAYQSIARFDLSG